MEWCLHSCAMFSFLVQYSPKSPHKEGSSCKQQYCSYVYMCNNIAHTCTCATILLIHVHVQQYCFLYESLKILPSYMYMYILEAAHFHQLPRVHTCTCAVLLSLVVCMTLLPSFFFPSASLTCTCIFTCKQLMV